MSSLLEITGDDIALLSDADLRSLIGQLCEADFRQAGLPTKGIIWGGHQDAPDEGMDVTVRGDVDPPPNSFVPRRSTGFQVKVPDMQPSRISNEMRPNGQLRGEIKSLINEHGAYIIANSKGATTEKALQNRIEAMRAAVTDEPNHQQLCLDFFDRGRIATWVRTHFSLILWVRNKIGRPLKGWQPYDNWAKAPGGVQEEFIIDDGVRLYLGSNVEHRDSIVGGLQKIRMLLSQNGASVRLTGLSGVGKTRLVQALFDERVGNLALNQYLAHYTDISDDPIPEPTFYATQLIAEKAKAILIIDNCSPGLHRRLNTLCAGSMVSLLTIEYDIRDDIPEETNVFRLEASSDRVIHKLLERRYPYISYINIQTITKFASGNARVAIALANTLKQDEGLSTLRDEELFNRLFHQRHHPNDDLRMTAEICSLVYSFNGEDTASVSSELKLLGTLATKSPQDIYRGVAELKNRGLVQARSVWRAVLPHAISNRLAKSALNSLPIQAVIDSFLSSDSERLIASFSRRLGYLHDCDPAIRIAEEWLRADGWIGKTNCNLNSLGRSIFLNIAPIAPEATLTMLERAADESNGLASLLNNDYVRLLKHLAYEADLFKRSAKLLSRLAQLEDHKTNDGGSARTALRTLFQIKFSGTHASVQKRASVIDELISSMVQKEQVLGIDLLEVALSTRLLPPSFESSFGSRPRDFGYEPTSNQEIVDWYNVFLTICTQTALLNEPISRYAERVLGKSLRGLWFIGAGIGLGFLDDLEYSVIQIHSHESWNAGWISVREIIRHDSGDMVPEARVKLEKLSRILKPVNLLEQARAYALYDGFLMFDPNSDQVSAEDSGQWERVHEKTQEIGAMVAQDNTVFRELIPALLSNYNERLGDFGEGLADGSKNRRRMWQLLYEQLEKTPPEKRQIAVMLGFLTSCGVHEPDLYHSILDSLVDDELLSQWFPHFQMTSAIDKRGIKRLIKVLDKEDVNIYPFERLSLGRRHEVIDDDDLVALMQKILTKEGGIRVVITMLNMRFHEDKPGPPLYSDELIEFARQVMMQFSYEEKSTRNSHLDYELARTASVSLRGQGGISPAAKLCENLGKGFKEYRIHSFDYPHLLRELAKIQPTVFLDAFVGNDDDYIFRSWGYDELERVDSPVNQIPENVLIDWCERDPGIRYQLIVSSMQIYIKLKDSKEVVWLPILSTIIENAPNLQALLSTLEGKIYPMSWGGSRADALAKRLPLFTKLSEHPNPEVRDWATGQYQKLEKKIQEEREYEIKEYQERFERFE